MKLVIFIDLTLSLAIKRRGFFEDILGPENPPPKKQANSQAYGTPKPNTPSKSTDGFNAMSNFFGDIMNAAFGPDEPTSSTQSQAQVPLKPPPPASVRPLMKFTYPNQKDIDEGLSIYNKYLKNYEAELEVKTLFKAANTFLQTNTTNYAYMYRVLKNYPKLESYANIYYNSIRKQLGEKLTVTSIMTFTAVFVEQYPDLQTQAINAINEFDRTNPKGVDYLLSLIVKYLKNQPKFRNNLYKSLDGMVSQNPHYYDILTNFISTWTRSNKQLVKRFLTSLAPLK